MSLQQAQSETKTTRQATLHESWKSFVKSTEVNGQRWSLYPSCDALSKLEMAVIEAIEAGKPFTVLANELPTNRQQLGTFSENDIIRLRDILQ